MLKSDCLQQRNPIYSATYLYINSVKIDSTLTSQLSCSKVHNIAVYTNIKTSYG